MRINEADLRLVLQAIDELRIIEKHMEDAFFRGSITLVHKDGYLIAEVSTVEDTDTDEWLTDFSAYRTGKR